jgi:hypothetical protein
MKVSKPKPTIISLTAMVLLLTAGLAGCNRSEDYKINQITGPTNKSLAGNLPLVREYKLTYNPQALGNIIMTLSDGSTCAAVKLQPATMTVLLQLLDKGNVECDTVHDEFRVKGAVL